MHGPSCTRERVLDADVPVPRRAAGLVTIASPCRLPYSCTVFGRLRRVLLGQWSLVSLVTLVACFASLPGMALCVGSDGHLAVEAVGGTCGPLRSESSPVRQSVASNHVHAMHGCRDTSLSVLSVRRTTERDNAFKVTWLQAIAPLTVRPASGAARLVEAAPSSGTSPARLSTVLLL